MTKEGNGQPTLFQVVVSELVQSTLEEFHSQASNVGQGDEFLATLRYVYQRLRSNPSAFGDPLYHLRALRLVVCRAFHANLVVEYAVHEEKPLVFIRSCRVI